MSIDETLTYGELETLDSVNVLNNRSPLVGYRPKSTAACERLESRGYLRRLTGEDGVSWFITEVGKQAARNNTQHLRTLVPYEAKAKYRRADRG